MSKSNELTAQTIEQSSDIPKLREKKHLKVIEKTYSSNTNSDYTEKIWDLAKNFDYTSNSNHYWGKPELSLLYGTPLYEVATPSQKLALNHLFWVANYHYISISEISTSLYNMITSGVFHNLGGYENLCNELELETDQESYHIRTFQKVVYNTKKSLFGKTTLSNPLASKSDKGWLGKLVPKPLQTLFLSGQYKTIFSGYQDYILSFVAKKMLANQKQYYSEYLREIEQKNQSIAAASEGILGQVAPRHWVKFFTLNWGISPFMACQYYCIRYTANAYLKNHEYGYYKNYQELQKKSEFIPDPTAISYYHLLDESFHTTISQTIAKDMYKELPKPTAYEKFLSAQIISMMQKNMLSGLSGALPGRFVADDPLFMLFVYKLLKSPVFAMSNQDSLYWMEKCFCQEHDGFHAGLKYHGKLLESLRRVFGGLEYQSSVNREMTIMATGGSIGNAIKGNKKVFEKFSRSIPQGN